MDKQRFEDLLKGYFKSELSEKEERFLLDALTKNPSQELLEWFDDIYGQEERVTAFDTQQRQRVWQGIQRKQSKQSDRKTQKIRRYAMIAGFFLLVATGLYWQLAADRTVTETLIGERVSAQMPIYLRDHAAATVHVLEQGTTTALSREQWKQYGLSLDSNHVLTLQTPLISKDLLTQTSLQITTHKGQVQQVQLADGSRIWLNGQSEIELPLAFATQQRRIRLRGEGYFEVFHSPDRPFQVLTPHNTIEVLGTHFNVAARPGDTERTTLTEGAVRISNPSTSLRLAPGEQAIGNQHLTKTLADTDAVLGWKTGDFYFDNLSLSELMDLVDEWYDISFVAYKHQAPTRFSGVFKRTNSLQELLENLEAVSSFRFELKNGGVYVLKK